MVSYFFKMQFFINFLLPFATDKQHSYQTGIISMPKDFKQKLSRGYL